MVTDPSSLTFLKGSSDGTVGSVHGNVDSPHGIVVSSHGTVGSFDGVVPDATNTEPQQSGWREDGKGTFDATHGSGGGDADPAAETRQPSDDDNSRLALGTESDAGAKNSLETLQQAGMDQGHGQVIRDGCGRKTGGARGSEAGAGEEGGEGVGMETIVASTATVVTAAEVAAGAGVAEVVSDAPECWEEFDESSLPTPAPVAPPAPTCASAPGQLKGDKRSTSGLTSKPSDEATLTSSSSGGGEEGGLVAEEGRCGTRDEESAEREVEQEGEGEGKGKVVVVEVSLQVVWRGGRRRGVVGGGRGVRESGGIGGVDGGGVGIGVSVGFGVGGGSVGVAAYHARVGYSYDLLFDQ